MFVHVHHPEDIDVRMYAPADAGFERFTTPKEGLKYLWCMHGNSFMSLFLRIPVSHQVFIIVYGFSVRP